MNGNQKRIFGAVALVVVVVGAAIYWASHPPRPTPTPAPQPAPDVSSQIEAGRQSAQDCLDQALTQIQQVGGDTPHALEKRNLEKRWVQYLQQLQAEHNYPNWPGPPCDLYVRRTKQSVSQAVASGIAQLEVHGAGLDKITVSVTVAPDVSVPGGTLVIPVGAVFASATNSTQNMMAAESVRFAFSTDSMSLSTPHATPGPSSIWFRPATFETSDSVRLLRVSSPQPRPSQSVTQDIPVYCINRWRHTPKKEDRFSLAEPDFNSPVQKLVSCLEHTQEEHKTKQAAVWMLADNLMNMTAQTVAENLFANIQQEAPVDLDHFVVYVAGILRLDRSGMSDEKLEEKLEELRQQLSDNFEQKRRTFLWNIALVNVESFKTTAPLLQGCGFDLSNKEFFTSDIKPNTEPPAAQ